MKLYHGSNSEFETFKTKRGSVGYGYTMGAYFSSNPKESKRYGKIVKEYNISFDKLLDLSFIKENDVNGKIKFFNHLRETENIIFPNEKSMVYSNPYFGYTTLEGLDKSFNLIPKLKKKGYDGIAFNEGDGITYVVFYSDKIEKILREGGVISNEETFKPLGSAKELGITPKIAGHDMIALCDCGEKFSYQNSKKNFLWQCPECNGMKRIKIS